MKVLLKKMYNSSLFQISKMNVFCAFLFFIPNLFAQKNYTLQIVPLDTTLQFIEKNCTYPNLLTDTLSLKTTLQEVVLDLRKKTFLEANIDSLTLRDSTYSAYLHLGKSYRWLSIYNANIPTKWLQSLGFRGNIFQKKPFSFQQIINLEESILTFAENNGYPFAQIRLDSLMMHDGAMSAFLNLNKGEKFTIEKLEIQGDVEISRYYLEHYLGLEIGSPYNKSFIKKISDRLREIPFLKETRPPLVIFKGNEATIKIYIQRQNASRFDLLLGVQPSTNELGVQRRISLTGTANIDFQNQFGRAERFSADFQRLTAKTQSLKLAISYPYLLKLPFGATAKADYYKRDTTNFTFTWDMGIQYLLQGNNYLKAFWGATSSNLLVINEKQIINNRTLPSVLDFNYGIAGLECLQQSFDYRFNPRRGWSIYLKAGAGQKKIQKNSSILKLSDPNDPKFDFGTLYDTLQLKTFQSKIDAQIAFFIPLFKNSTLKIGAQGGKIISPKPIFQNEQYRIGGNRLLRGFDEESLFASNYLVGILEYRLLLDKNSYFYVFGDGSYIENITPSRRTYTYPLGFGGGMTIETKVGLLGISLGWGKPTNIPIDWRATKVHFGYVSLF